MGTREPRCASTVSLRTEHLLLLGALAQVRHLDGVALVVADGREARVTMDVQKLRQVELGLLEDLDLLDEHVLEGEDLGALFSDLAGNLVAEAAIKY